MVELTIDGIKTRVDEGTTAVEAAREMGIIIPTLCYYRGLDSYAGCRICVVEVVSKGRSSLEASCTLLTEDGQVIHTNTERVRNARKIIIELLLASCPNSKLLQDMASNMGVNKVRFKIKDRGCILCGRCVRFCKEEMRSGGIGFIGRGTARKVGPAFDVTPEECRNCGGCQWICPVCERACTAGNLIDGICGGCRNVTPVETCLICTHCSESVGPAGHKVF